MVLILTNLIHFVNTYHMRFLIHEVDHTNHFHHLRKCVNPVNAGTSNMTVIVRYTQQKLKTICLVLPFTMVMTADLFGPEVCEYFKKHLNTNHLAKHT